MVLLAVLQVGLVARDVVLVTHASREAARAAAVDPDTRAPYRPRAPRAGSTPSGCRCVRADAAAPGSRVRVEVSYRVRTAVPIVGALVGDHTVKSTATMRVEGP